jgi:hypothetical protein
MILVKNIIVIKKHNNEDGTYDYRKIILPINQIMTDKELKQQQKQISEEYQVKQNMIGGTTVEI